MIEFFPDKTQVFFSCFDKAINVSSVFCEIQLPFMSAPLTIRCYGVIIAFGLLLAVLFGGRRAYVWKIDINKMIDILIYGMVAGIIGARAYYVLSEWNIYSQYPSEIFKIWHGGLAIYGGLIGGIIAAIAVCIVEKVNIRNLLDLCGMSFLIGQGIGRWGNFANQEAFGVNTTLPWGMFSEKTQAYLTALMNSGTDLGVDPSKPVHPTFLYESLWCLAAFAFMYWFCCKKRKFSGQIFLLYGIFYGAERAFVEGLRTDSLYIQGTNLRVSQVLSIVLASVCFVLFIIFTIKYTKNPKPIEGVDYFREIPVYNKKKKALDAKKAWEKAEEKAAAAEGFKAEKLRADAAKKKALYDKAQAESDAKEAKKAAKKAKKNAAPAPAAENAAETAEVTEPAAEAEIAEQTGE